VGKSKGGGERERQERLEETEIDESRGNGSLARTRRNGNILETKRGQQVQFSLAPLGWVWKFLGLRVFLKMGRSESLFAKGDLE
jgi:hypothetical protein